MERAKETTRKFRNKKHLVDIPSSENGIFCRRLTAERLLGCAWKRGLSCDPPMVRLVVSLVCWMTFIFGFFVIRRC